MLVNKSSWLLSKKKMLMIWFLSEEKIKFRHSEKAEKFTEKSARRDPSKTFFLVSLLHFFVPLTKMTSSWQFEFTRESVF